MPRNKKKADSTSDSDSGPDDRNSSPPAKKSKETKKDADEKKTAPSSSDGGVKNEWTLEKLRKVRINEFRGRVSIDIREFYEKDGEFLPGKKGISLTPVQWRKLLEVADEINKAVTQMA